MNTIILLDKREFKDYKISIPAEHEMLFLLVMKSHGWKPQENGSHKNKAICIDMDEIIQEGK